MFEGSLNFKSSLMVMSIIGFCFSISGTVLAQQTGEQIIFSCGAKSQGDPIAWAGCVGGTFTIAEAEKCIKSNGSDCFSEKSEIRKAMSIVAQLFDKRQDTIFIVNDIGGGLAFSLEGSDPLFHDSQRKRDYEMAQGQGSFFYMNNTRYWLFLVTGQAYEIHTGNAYKIIRDFSKTPNEFQIYPVLIN